jgi:sarcosine oxidase subunit alpha
MRLLIDNQEIEVPDGISVAVAVIKADCAAFRRSVRGENRYPLCGMGICFECRVTIDGARHQRSCLIQAHDGMVIETA